MGSVSQPVSYASFYTWQYRDPRTRMVADVRPRLSMIFNLIGASDFDT